jgi:hypothetical protein
MLSRAEKQDAREYRKPIGKPPGLLSFLTDHPVVGNPHTRHGFLFFCQSSQAAVVAFTSFIVTVHRNLS